MGILLVDILQVLQVCNLLNYLFIPNRRWCTASRPRASRPCTRPGSSTHPATPCLCGLRRGKHEVRQTVSARTFLVRGLVVSARDDLHHLTIYHDILYYTILYYTILYYTMLYYAILYYTILYYTLHIQIQIHIHIHIHIQILTH